MRSPGALTISTGSDKLIAMQVLRCVLCLTGFCLHAVPNGGESDCENRLAETVLSGSAVCGPCAKARLQIEAQNAWEEAERNDKRKLGVDSETTPDSEATTAKAPVIDVSRIFGRPESFLDDLTAGNID